MYVSGWVGVLKDANADSQICSSYICGALLVFAAYLNDLNDRRVAATGESSKVCRLASLRCVINLSLLQLLHQDPGIIQGSSDLIFAGYYGRSHGLWQRGGIEEVFKPRQ